MTPGFDRRLRSIFPPVAKRAPATASLHQDSITDDYHWLRKRDDVEVRNYLDEEQHYTDTVLKSVAVTQETLYREMRGRIQETDRSVPYKWGRYWYYTRTEEGKQYPIYCRKEDRAGAKEHITLDLNVLAQGKEFTSLGVYEVSDNNELLAYSIDITGARDYTLYIKDLRSNRLRPDQIEKVDGVVWATDNQTLFYTTEDAAKRPYRLIRYGLGRRAHEVLYEETDELFSLWVERSQDRKYIFLVSNSADTSEVHIVESDRPNGSIRTLLPRLDQHEYYVEHHRGRFYIRTNKKAQNFRIISTPVDDLREDQWSDFIRHSPDVMLEEMQFFAEQAIVWSRRVGLPYLLVVDIKTNQSHEIELPESPHALSGDHNPDFDTSTFRFQFESMVTPPCTFDYDMKTRQLTLLKKESVLGGYRSDRYQSERRFAVAQDGSRIPISLVYRKGIGLDGNQPLLLYGYGAYGISIAASFSTTLLSLLDRGVIYAIAHVRGGGELGKVWHDQGKMLKKKTTFEDFIACAEFLIRENYTSRDKLVIEGSSAGGLLVGAVLNMRPDLFSAAILNVPFVDVINTMLDPSLPLTVGEYREWGNPRNRNEYDYMKSYCPYSNLGTRNYPTMLVRTSFHDTQVMYWEPTKYVAKLRSCKTDTNLLLLNTNMNAGHGGPSGRYDELGETALDFAFILSLFQDQTEPQEELGLDSTK